MSYPKTTPPEPTTQTRWPVQRHWPDDYTPEERLLIEARVKLRLTGRPTPGHPRTCVVTLGGVTLIGEVKV